MASRVLQLLGKTAYDFGGLGASQSLSLVVARGIDAVDFTEGTLAVRVHGAALLVEVEATQGTTTQALSAELSAELVLRERLRLAYGVHGFTNSAKYYQTAAGEGVRGSGSGYWLACLFRLDQIPAASEYLGACGAAGTTGWQQWLTSSGLLRFRTHNGAGASVHAPNITLGSSDVGRVHAALWVQDASKVRSYLAGAEVGSGTSISGYTAPASTVKQTMGIANPFNYAFTSGTILGVAGGDGVIPSAAEIAAWAARCRAARDIVPIAGKTDHLWSVRQHGSAAPAEIADSAGSDGMDRTGALGVDGFRPRWGW